MNKIDNTNYKAIKELELIEDPCFFTGFNVLGISSVDDKRDIKMKINYHQTVCEQCEHSPWYMAQWWTPYSLVDAKYSHHDGKHIYQTKSRTIEVNPKDNGYLHIELLGSEEYRNKPRKSLSESWPHALIEQSFSKSVKLDELERLIVRLDVSVDKCLDLNGKDYNPSLHAAQLLWYFTIHNVDDLTMLSSGLGKNDNYFWFGVPILDSRFDFLNQSSFIDAGSLGTTNKLIYSMDSRHYIKEKIQMKKTYQINLDILPYIKEAFAYALKNNSLINAKFENMEIGYMNFGWELPGMFNVGATIRNMSVKAILK